LSAKIEHLEAAAYKVPTDSFESDGTLEWSSTTMVLVRAGAGRIAGMGYTYEDECCVPLLREKLFPLIQEADPMDIPALVEKMNAAVRNVGRSGVAATAIAAVEIALWDLKARLLDLPLVKLLGAVRGKIPVYGSGGFTSYSETQLCRQLAQWTTEGISMVKMKVGREPETDPVRVQWARNAVGEGAEIFVDANGAYSERQALTLARTFAEKGVDWFEEPVSGSNLKGLHFLREHGPANLEISAGEYNYDCLQARQMLEAGAVDVLQADATRCGVTGFLQTAALCDAFDIPLSSHTAPAIHGHLCCASRRARHAEYFHDHVRIEQMFFDGATTAHKNGFLEPDLSQAGLGLEFKGMDAAKYRIEI
jgi:L-alanine-DL-glutamate epimerase-like enolase superfamily enzyme